MRPNFTRRDLAHSPFVVFYEVTRACDLVCRHCRACAQAWRDPQELGTASAKQVIRQLTEFPKPPLLVFTGGDPMKREDVFELIAHAKACGLELAMTPSATPLVTAEAIRTMRDAGIGRLAVSLDGVDAATHDAFRGVEGSFARTFEIMADARAADLPLQVNTTITRRNVHQVDALAELLATQPPGAITLWSVFFLIPTGRGTAEQRISAHEYEEVFERLWHHARHQPYGIKTTEAHHYRRFVLQKGADPRKGRPQDSAAAAQRAPLGVNDGNGVLFISHTGRIYPSGFLPIECGRVPSQSIVDIYQRSPVFKALRDADGFKGKCGVCEFRHVCGGSRSRAYAVTGDMLESEPDCLYEPAAFTRSKGASSPAIGMSSEASNRSAACSPA